MNELIYTPSLLACFFIYKEKNATKQFFYIPIALIPRAKKRKKKITMVNFKVLT